MDSNALPSNKTQVSQLGRRLLSMRCQQKCAAAIAGTNVMLCIEFNNYYALTGASRAARRLLCQALWCGLPLAALPRCVLFLWCMFRCQQQHIHLELAASSHTQHSCMLGTSSQSSGSLH